MDYIAEAKELVKNLNQRMGPSAYDIAWMARLKSEDGGPRWPDLIDWLLNNQYDDGSWGGKIQYYHDRIICTLISAIALFEYRDDFSVEQSVQRAEQYIWSHLHLLPRDPFELVGFELIVPTLMEEARFLGLDVPRHTCGYGEIQTAKLRLIPLEKLYSPKISTVHSLEFLGRHGDVDQLQRAVGRNGSLGNSPAATSYYLLLNPSDSRAWTYLERVRRYNTSVIYLYPFRTFEITWVLNNLMFSGTDINEYLSPVILDDLEESLGLDGVGLDIEFGIPDGDITSVCSHILLAAGRSVDPVILSKYENLETHLFRTYNYERNLSVSTNVHVLNALNLMPGYPQRDLVREQIILMLLDSRKYNMYWTDKWHASPYYATAHAVVGLLSERNYLAHACSHTIDWILHTQRDDGSWGFFDRGTAEETSYALTALLHQHQYRPVDVDVIHSGVDFLLERYCNNAISSYPEFWIGKDLFVPLDVVRSAILAALILYERVLG
jgi:halimadienyl-diphosphate synthase